MKHVGSTDIETDDVGWKLLETMKAIYKNRRASVKVNGVMSEHFRIDKGIRHNYAILSHGCLIKVKSQLLIDCQDFQIYDINCPLT